LLGGGAGLIDDCRGDVLPAWANLRKRGDVWRSASSKRKAAKQRRWSFSLTGHNSRAFALGAHFRKGRY